MADGVMLETFPLGEYCMEVWGTHNRKASLHIDEEGSYVIVMDSDGRFVEDTHNLNDPFELWGWLHSS